MVGLFGFGNIARCLCKKLQGIGCEVRTADPFVKPETAAEYGVEIVDFDTLVAESDYISIHAPLNDATRHSFSGEQFDRMKPTASIINTSRGPVIDEAALVAALREKKISRAALDVYDQEPLPADNPFRELDNVFMTPHIAGASRQARHRQGQFTVEEIGRFLSGQPLRYQVTADMLETMA